MPFNNDEDNAYLDLQLKMALDSWDPAKPRRWLARYGGLPGLGIGTGVVAKEYKALLVQAQALTQRKRRVDGGDSLPNINYPLW
ncbi:hypothetical protein [Aeromonas veronii]|jgi:hypothetical protein|uniref:hypothetical protein n=1 Tax=Aeromonas veronii TaxID=654 RepID=UPI003D20DFD5